MDTSLQQCSDLSFAVDEKYPTIVSNYGDAGPKIIQLLAIFMLDFRDNSKCRPLLHVDLDISLQRGTTAPILRHLSLNRPNTSLSLVKFQIFCTTKMSEFYPSKVIALLNLLSKFSWQSKDIK